jgi:alginate O-acetyltransferase complex protein AlgI
VSGFWHGANWTLIAWGVLNALYFIPLLLSNNNRNNLNVVAEGKILPSLRELIAMLSTFSLTVFAWIFFRAENINHAFSYIGGVFSSSILSMPEFNGMDNALIILCLIGGFLVIEWLGRNDKFALEKVLNNIKLIRVVIYIILITSLFLFATKPQDFIYFQF